MNMLANPKRSAKDAVADLVLFMSALPGDAQ
jgi:hypothetical protein